MMALSFFFWKCEGAAVELNIHFGSIYPPAITQEFPPQRRRKSRKLLAVHPSNQQQQPQRKSSVLPPVGSSDSLQLGSTRSISAWWAGAVRTPGWCVSVLMAGEDASPTVTGCVLLFCLSEVEVRLLVEEPRGHSGEKTTTEKNNSAVQKKLLLSVFWNAIWTFFFLLFNHLGYLHPN